MLRRLELNPNRAALASQRYNAVRLQLESALPGVSVSQVGSFQRRTKIRPLDASKSLDIDVAVCLGHFNRYVSDGSGISPSRALGAAEAALVLDGTYRAMKPESDAPTVVLEYSDGFRIELIPCYHDLSGSFPRTTGPPCYVVGDSSGNWIPADYDYDAAIISGANNLPAIAQSLVPSIKMIKGFIRNTEASLKSFHTEVLTALTIPAALADWNSRGLSWGYHHVLAQFLTAAPAHLNGPVAIPGSYSPSIDSGLSAYGLQQIADRLRKCGDLAWRICKVEDDAQALDLWRQFYGEPFPA